MAATCSGPAQAGIPRDNLTTTSVAAQGSPQLKEVHHLRTKGYVNAVAWNSDGSELAVLSNFGAHIALWDAKNWSLLNEFDRYSSAYSQNSLAFLPDGSLLTAAPLGPYPDDPHKVSSLLSDHPYRTLDWFSLIQWRPETGKVVRYFPDAVYPSDGRPNERQTTNTFAVSPSGALVAGATNDDRVFLYDQRSASLLQTIKVTDSKTPKDFSESIAFSPDEHLLAVGTISGRVLLFNLPKGTLAKTIIAFPDGHFACGALAFSPDGTLIVVGKEKVINLQKADDVVAAIFRVADGQQVSSLTGSTSLIGGHPEPAPTHTLAWSPKGFLAVGDEAGLGVWNMNGARPALTLTRALRLLYSTQYSTTGSLAAAYTNEVIIFQQ